MASTVFPAPSTSTSSVNARVFATAASYTTYEINESFESGGYTVTTSPSNSQVSLVFTNSNSILVDTKTVSGTVSFSLPSDATTLSLADISGNAITTVTVTYTSVNATGSLISGTLDTITTTSTYNQTGLLYPLLVGGGSSGGGGAAGAGGGGGGGGGVDAGIVYTNTSTSIIIGTAGGGTTNFGNLLNANGGNGGGGASGNGVPGGGGSTGNGSRWNGLANGANQSGPIANANLAVAKSVSNGTNGGGGAGVGSGTGAGSGIGTGGNGGSPGNAGSGYGAGGGGGNPGFNGGLGTQGVVYVLRGF